MPIPDACVFQSRSIEILNRDLSVDIVETPANCNALGSLNIQALNVRANYHYEIRLADGTPPPATSSPDYYAEHPGGTLLDDENRSS